MQKDTYKHLNDDGVDAMRIDISMEELAKQICAKNYGTHRFLSALVDELRKVEKERCKEGQQKYNGSPLADKIEPLLDEYYY